MAQSADEFKGGYVLKSLQQNNIKVAGKGVVKY